MHIMARQQRAQSVRAFTPPAAAQFGAQVFVFVGTDAHTSPRLEETDLIRKLGWYSQGWLQVAVGCLCAVPGRCAYDKNQRFLPPAKSLLPNGLVSHSCRTEMPLNFGNAGE